MPLRARFNPGAATGSHCRSHSQSHLPAPPSWPSCGPFGKKLSHRLPEAKPQYRGRGVGCVSFGSSPGPGRGGSSKYPLHTHTLSFHKHLSTASGCSRNTEADALQAPSPGREGALYLRGLGEMRARSCSEVAGRPGLGRREALLQSLGAGEGGGGQVGECSNSLKT